VPFASLGLSPELLRAVAQLGFEETSPIQAAAIPLIMSGRDVVGQSETGSGKTAAFCIPAVERVDPAARATQVLILTPTRELATQVADEVHKLAAFRRGVHSVAIYGGASYDRQFAELKRGAHVVVGTPGRLTDHMNRGTLDLTRVRMLILDEADRMLDMGFIHPIRQIVRLLPRQRLTLLFSATLSREIEQLSREFMHHPKMVEIGRRSNPAETVTQYLYEISHHAKMSLLSHLLKNEALKTVLVFSRTKHGADRIARRLETARIPCATLHANRSQNQRLRALHDFKNGRVRVLVATDIAARGIDVEGISHVINYDFPRHPEDYVHRIGRTGRAQAVGEAISFLAPDDHSHLRTLERFLRRGVLRRKVEGFTEPTNTAAPRDPSAPPPAPYRPRRDTMPWRLRRSWKNKRRFPGHDRAS